MTDEKKIYLGDGAYATFSGYDIKVTAENGLEATDTVHLDGAAILKLVSFAHIHGLVSLPEGVTQ